MHASACQVKCQARSHDSRTDNDSFSCLWHRCPPSTIPPPIWRGNEPCAALASCNVGHMRQFRQDELLHSQPYRGTRAGHRDNHRAAHYASRGPTHHCRCTNLGIAQIAKKLAKARQLFLKTTLHDLIGAIARGKPRATAEQNSIRVLGLHEVRQQTPDILRLVLDDAISADRMTRLREHLLHVRSE